LGNTDPRLVAAIVMQLDQETTQSTGTRGRLRRRVEATLTAEHGQGMVALPSKATFNRLVGALSAGRHTFGSAVTRRSQANRPERPFTPTLAARPGEQVQIDTSPLDVAAVFEDGVTGRVELTMAVDVATPHHLRGDPAAGQHQGGGRLSNAAWPSPMARLETGRSSDSSSTVFTASNQPSSRAKSRVRWISPRASFSGDKGMGTRAS
jgi:hypothetical protein